MRIYSMEATFGNLEQQTLTLKPGLNIIEAPNEWGKTTWCAFLIAMLYGFDADSRTDRFQLSDKERFRPWSGSPMEGRIDLRWNGRDITIQRTTQGPVPMGEFRAYETVTGLTIPELTSENCGLLLLGVEKEVFTRSGFLRFADLPVTEDEQLRSRLNALMTTGDESGNAALLERKLRELKNRCRYNQSGLIPQLRQQKEKVEQELQEWETLDQQLQKLQSQVAAKEQQLRLLENHRTALRYQAAQSHLSALQEAKAAKEDAQRQLENLRDQVEVVPTRETATKNIRVLKRIQEQLSDIQMEEQMLPPTAEIPPQPPGFAGCTSRQAVIQAQQHRDELQALSKRHDLASYIIIPLGVFFTLFTLFLFWLHQIPMGIVCGCMSLAYWAVTLMAYLTGKKRHATYLKRRMELTALYHCDDPEQWILTAQQYVQDWDDYAGSDNATLERKAQLLKQREVLMSKLMVLTRSRGLEHALEYWHDIASLWDEYAESRCNYRQAVQQYRDLQELCADAHAPTEPDTLTLSEEETEQQLSIASAEHRQLLSKLGQFRGYADSLGTKEALEAENANLETRLEQLEKTYAALDLALKTLAQASGELQQRFAPRISRTAQELMNRLTDGRYDRLTVTQDFSLLMGARNEDVLRSKHWRSDGTVDQLYLALRLAVARELLPDAPLVLDDAMVRFDNKRLQAALKILQQEAANKQVIIFTCHARERRLLEELLS